MNDHDHSHGEHDHQDSAHDHRAHHHHDPAEVRLQPVVLDLGDGVGALIVHTDPELLGVEVEISPAGADDDRQHKEVLRRAMGPVAATVLVYDNLAEGDYTLWIDGVAVTRRAHVTSGRVAELDWRSTPVAASASSD